MYTGAKDVARGGRIRSSYPGRGELSQRVCSTREPGTQTEMLRGSPQHKGQLEEGVRVKTGRSAAASVWKFAYVQPTATGQCVAGRTHHVHHKLMKMDRGLSKSVFGWALGYCFTVPKQSTFLMGQPPRFHHKKSTSSGYDRGLVGRVLVKHAWRPGPNTV